MFIVIDGLDGCGKSTQIAKIQQYFDGAGLNYRKIKLPDYDSPSSSLVNMYLAGDFGESADSVNAYTATAFFAVDRFANFNLKWKKDYENGVHIIADRYTTSNALHQASKLTGTQRDEFLDWLWDFEYVKLGLPKPDAVIYLDMPVEISQKLMTSRYDGDEQKKDVHERDVNYLNHCRESALYTASKCGWNVINCGDGDSPRAISDISADIIAVIEELLHN